MDPFLQILKRLSEQGVDYVLIGGMAAVAHGSPVVTQDLDTLVAAKKVANREKDHIAIRHLEAIKRFRQQNPGLLDQNP